MTMVAGAPNPQSTTIEAEWRGTRGPRPFQHTLASSWTATAAGQNAAACRGWPDITPGPKTSGRITIACADAGVEVLTIYRFSTENWRRPAEEVLGLMRLLLQRIDTLRQHLPENVVAPLERALRAVTRREAFRRGNEPREKGRFPRSSARAFLPK